MNNKQKRLVGRIMLLVALTVVIIILGVIVPRRLIDRKIRISSSSNDRVKIEAISPYGENSVEVEERIKAELERVAGELEIDFSEFDWFEDNGGFTSELFGIIDDMFGVRPMKTYVRENDEYNITEIWDFSMGTTLFYADTGTGMILTGSMEFRSNTYQTQPFWEEIRMLYSNYLGIEFVERSVEKYQDSIYAEAVTTDGALALSLSMWVDLPVTEPYDYEDNTGYYAVYFEISLSGR